MKNQAKNTKNHAVADLGNGRTMDLEFIPVPTIEADEVNADFVPNAEDVVAEVKPAKVKKIKAAKATKDNSVENRGRKLNPNSARQIRLAALAEMKASGVESKRGRKSDPNSANALRKAEMEKKRAAGEVVRRGRPSGTSSPKTAKVSPRVKLDKTNSIRVQGKTYITLLKADKLNAEAREFCNFKSTLNHPSLGKCVEFKA